MHEKLAILLSSDIQDSGVELFNTEEEILEILCKRQKDQESQTKSKEVIFQSQQPLAVVWDEGQERKWYIGLFVDNNDNGTVRIDHLEMKRAKETWIWPRIEDIQDVKDMQIVPCSINSEWVLSSRSAVLHIKNPKEVDTVFQELFM